MLALRRRAETGAAPADRAQASVNDEVALHHYTNAVVVQAAWWESTA
jgi:hypothetical protein